MDINEYIDKVYNGKIDWFADEVEQSYNIARISNVLGYKNYLNGVHNILKKSDMKYKEELFITRKLVIQECRTILNFHSTYLLGKPLSLTGTENMVKEFEKVYRKGCYNDIDFRLNDKMAKFGDSYEYVYLEGKKIKSKIIDSAEGYPVFSEDNLYVAFIEHWCINGIYYYIVYYENEVQEWNNEGANVKLNMTSSYPNCSGLPICYHNFNDSDDNFGTSLIKDIRPILDEIEDLLSKMGDSIYTLSLNPLLVSIGQPIVGSLSADGVGYCVGLEMGSDLKYVSATMDYNTIKLYLDTLGQKLNMVSHMPSIVSGGNIANVSEVSLKLLYQLADVLAMLSEKCMVKGITQRFEIFEKLLVSQGITFNEDDYVSVSFNYSRPQNMTELLDNLTKQFNMGAISMRTIIEKSPLTTDVAQELFRIKEEEDSLNLDDVETDIIDTTDTQIEGELDVPTK
ncbi:MAG: SPP1 family phage portal protein [Clostridium sp.]|jgi:SPP1 family phage portal protein